jgi:Ala-tRNA(Pro) deacylase
MNLRSYLDQSGVQYQWLHHDMAYTAQELAQREHTSGRKVIKPVVVEADGQHLLCALPAAYQVDLERLREELHATAAKLADEQTMQQLFKDCELGAEPPIGGMFGLPTLMDESVEAQDEVTFQAGTHQDAVRMSVEDYMRITNPRVANFRR